MWIVIVIGAPVLVLAIGIAVWPVLSRSYRYRHGRADRDGRVATSAEAKSACALCGAEFEASTGADVIAAKNEHMLRSHAHRGSEAEPVTAMSAEPRRA
jgi:hypothetical protein